MNSYVVFFFHYIFINLYLIFESKKKFHKEENNAIVFKKKKNKEKIYTRLYVYINIQYILRNELNGKVIKQKEFFFFEVVQKERRKEEMASKESRNQPHSFISTFGLKMKSPGDL